MKQIPLTKGYFATVDDEDFESLSKFKWLAGAQPTGLVYALHRGTLMHRRILEKELEDKPIHVDHINGNGLDNRRSNLRLCTSAQNQMNRRKQRGKCASKYKGVRRCRKKWQAHLKKDGKYFFLGTFEKEEDAALAYNLAAVQLFEKFARVNELPARGGSVATL